MNSTMTDTSTFLSIAGYTLKLHFHDSISLNGKRSPSEVKALMLEHNEGFILKNPPHKYDYLIQFVEQGSHIYHKDEKNISVDVFREVTKRKIIVNTHISRNHFVYVLRYVVNKLIAHDGFILHSSANLVKNSAVIYCGPSGAGKSTAVHLLQDRFPILSDDECYIKREKEGYFYYQGPFLEKRYDYAKTSKRYPISHFLLLQKSIRCTIVPISSIDKILTRLARQVWIGGKAYSSHAMNNLTKCVAQVPCSYLYFPKNADLLWHCISSHFKIRQKPTLNSQ